MKMKFKLTAVLLILLALFSVLSCAKKEAPAATAPEAAPATKINLVEETVKNVIANIPANKNYQIPAAEFIGKVKAGEPMFVLDIRQPDVYAQGHIKGAVNAPYGSSFAEVLEKIPADKPVYVYCYTGQTAGQIMTLLSVAGFNTRSVSFGWNLGIAKEEGYAEVTDTTPNQFDPAVATEIDSEIKDAIVAFLKGLDTVKGTTWANYMIGEAETKAIMDAEDTSVVILSVRRAEDYAKGHIKGAINIPFGSEMYSGFASLPKDKKIIVYCYSGQTANLAITTLRLLGYDAVSMRNGMGVAKNAPNGWANKGYPTVAN